MRIGVAEMRMLRWMCEHTKLDRIRSVAIKDKVRAASIEDKKRDVKLRLFGYIRRSMNAPVKRCEKIAPLEGKRG